MWTEERVIYDLDNKRRVLILRSANGSYSFVEECFSEDPYEQCWIPVTKGRSIPICDSIDTVLREAKGRIDWFSESAIPTGDA